jgi:hypothetical protein
MAYLEQVGGMIGGRNPAAPMMFNFGCNYGYVKGVCAALHLPVRLVRPAEWQKAAGVGIKGKMSDNLWKNKLKAEAQRRYPGLKITLKTADALLILDWARGINGTQD